MKQILQSLKTGKTKAADVPCPQLRPGHLLVRTHVSLISSGTEKMLLDFGKASFINKIRKQPGKVRAVIDKIKTDGLFPTIEAVQHKLDKLLPLGYCNVGTIIAVAADISGFVVGERVVSNGPHAEVVSVAQNLCCKISETITDEEAVFTVLGAIALQGIRLAAPTLGECFTVFGLGLIGLLTVQLLKAHGCQVLGIDMDETKVRLAEKLGAQAFLLSHSENLLTVTQQFSRGRGVDGVIVTAATKSSKPIHQAAEMCRKRGRIILVGVTGLHLSRADFYEKELSFQVSCSYGPGRYDFLYEKESVDYPIGFVRWTAQRNFEAFLDLLNTKRLDVSQFISHRFLISDAEKAYTLLTSPEKKSGILLTYPTIENTQILLDKNVPLLSFKSTERQAFLIGVIGAGNYATRVLLPAFQKQSVTWGTIACQGGISGIQAGKKFNFRTVTTDPDSIFMDENIHSVIIASQHETHAQFILKAVQAKKHIFVEKPLCLTLDEQNEITHQLKDHDKVFMVGFNRRFAPHTLLIKRLLKSCQGPKSFIMTINAGFVSKDHWTQNKKVGGGRLIGEACHFVDLLRFLADAPIHSFQTANLKNSNNYQETVSFTLIFTDGSIGTVHYFANGHKGFPKERLEIFCDGKILQLDNFRVLYGHGFGAFKKMRLWRQDKGQTEAVKQFVDAIKQQGTSPLAITEILEVSRTTIEIANSV